MKKYLITMLVGAVVILAGSIASCNRDENGMGRLQVRMMDAPSPFDFDAIYLDVVGVQVNVEPEDGDPHWISLTTGVGVYNIMTLVNGSDVVLSDQEIPAGRITQIRLLLSEGNTIVVEGQSFPLIIPSGQESGLKLNVHEVVGDDEVLTLMIDFDAAHSVHVLGNGVYHLKPVMRAVVLERTGSIHAAVTFNRGNIAIVATAGTETYSTYADRDRSEFLIRALPPGNYTVSIYYPDAEAPVVFNDVEVRAGEVTEL